MNGHQIYLVMETTGHFTGATADSGDGTRKLADSHQEVADKLTQLRMSMEKSWKGEAAEAAFKELRTYEKVSAEAGSRNLQVASTSMSAESDTHSTVRNQLEPMPAEPEEAGFWSFMPWEDSQEDLNRQWAEQNRRNIEIYQTYQSATDSHTKALSQPFPSFDGGGTGDPGEDKKKTNIDDRRTSNPYVGTGGTTTPSGTGGATGGRTSGTPTVRSSTGGSGGYSGGSSAAPGGGVRLLDGSIRMPDGSVRTPDGSTRYPDGSVRTPDGSTRYPDGSVRLPDGSIRKPDGTIVRMARSSVPTAPSSARTAPSSRRTGRARPDSARVGSTRPVRVAVSARASARAPAVPVAHSARARVSARAASAPVAPAEPPPRRARAWAAAAAWAA